jgi:NAD(P)H-dependent FMN reductase
VFYIPIILGSSRRGRQSAKVARFIAERMQHHELIETEVLDLLDYELSHDGRAPAVSR